jgi:hypothetical protein
VISADFTDLAYMNRLYPFYLLEQLRMGCNRVPLLRCHQRQKGHPLLADPSDRPRHLRRIRSSRRRPELRRRLAFRMLVSLVDAYSPPLYARLTKLEHIRSLCASTSKTSVSRFRELP